METIPLLPPGRQSGARDGGKRVLGTASSPAHQALAETWLPGGGLGWDVTGSTVGSWMATWANEPGAAECLFWGPLWLLPSGQWQQAESLQAWFRATDENLQSTCSAIFWPHPSHIWRDSAARAAKCLTRAKIALFDGHDPAKRGRASVGRPHQIVTWSERSARKPALINTHLPDL